MTTAPFELGIVCAVPEETAALRPAFDLTEEAAAGPFAMLRGQAHGIGLHLAQAGIGKANVAALAAHMLTLHPAIGLMAFSGIAGALHEDLHPGDLVVAAETATHDYGAVREGRLDWFPAGAIPIGPAPPPVCLSTLVETPALARTLAGFGGRVRRGRVISGDVFLNCRTTRDRLFADWQADAIDMESAAFAETAARWACPVLILRTISDRACEASHLTYAQMAEAAAANSAAFLSAFVAELAGDPASVALLRASPR